MSDGIHSPRISLSTNTFRKIFFFILLMSERKAKKKKIHTLQYQMLNVSSESIENSIRSQLLAIWINSCASFTGCFKYFGHPTGKYILKTKDCFHSVPRTWQVAIFSKNSFFCLLCSDWFIPVFLSQPARIVQNWLLLSPWNFPFCKNRKLTIFQCRFHKIRFRNSRISIIFNHFL